MPCLLKNKVYLLLTAIVIFSLLIMFAGVLKVEEPAYAISSYTVRFYFVDGETTEFLSAQNVDAGGSITNIPSIDYLQGYVIHWYDEAEEIAAIEENGIMNINADASYYAKYDLFFNTINGFVADGREENPYVIDTRERLKIFSDINNGESIYTVSDFENEYIILDSDLDLTGFTINPIISFKGNLNGNYFTISNFTLNDTEEGFAGLIRNNYGTVSRLNISGRITAAGTAGGIAGNNQGRIENCGFSGVVSTSADIAGGLAGENRSEVSGCYNTAKVSALSSAAGIAGINSGSVSGCFNTGEISANQYAGGIVAHSFAGGISYCYNTGVVSLEGALLSGIAAAGIAPLSDEGEIKDCYNVGLIIDNTDDNALIGATVADIGISEVGNLFYDSALSIDGNCDIFSVALSTMEMTGGDNSLVFTDINYWIYAEDDLEESKVYYPQLSTFVYSGNSNIAAISLNSAQKNYATCLVTLYDDYGNFLNEYSVFSGTEKLPETFEKIGFTAKGWSGALGGALIDPESYISYDINLYSVYEINSPFYSLNAFTVSYGYDLTAEFIVSHIATDYTVSYQWYRMVASQLVLLENETFSTLVLTECSESGNYQCRATLVSGKYSTYAYDTKKMMITPHTFEIISVPLFTRSYTDIEEPVTAAFAVSYGDNKNAQVFVEFTREAGNDAGSYDILTAVSLNGNFAIELTGDCADKYIIGKAEYSFSFSFNQENIIYDGEVHSLSYNANLPEGIEVTISMVGDGIGAGEHYLMANFAGDYNNYYEIDSVTATMIISKATYNLEGMEINSVGAIYDGLPHNAYLTGQLPDGVKANFSVSNVTEAEQYNVIISFDGDYVNYYRIKDCATVISIMPKAIEPIFVLPDNMVADGLVKNITATSEGIITGDEVEITVTADSPLVAAGIYHITASITNPNYILFGNNATIEIYAPLIRNTGETAYDFVISREQGLNSAYIFTVVRIYPDQEEIIENFGSNKLVMALSAYLTIEGIGDIVPTEGITVTLKVPEGFENARNLRLAISSGGDIKVLEYSLEDGYISFETTEMGDIYIIMDRVFLPHEPVDTVDWLKIILYLTFVIILILIILMIILLLGTKRPATVVSKPNTPPVKPYWSILKPLSEEERKNLAKKLENGELVDWELNRDLPLYAKFSDEKISKDGK